MIMKTSNLVPAVCRGQTWPLAMTDRLSLLYFALPFSCHIHFLFALLLKNIVFVFCLFTFTHGRNSFFSSCLFAQIRIFSRLFFYYLLIKCDYIVNHLVLRIRICVASFWFEYYTCLQDIVSYFISNWLLADCQIRLFYFHWTDQGRISIFRLIHLCYFKGGVQIIKMEIFNGICH